MEKKWFAELPDNENLPLIVMNIKQQGSALRTEVYHKSAYAGPILHFHSNKDIN